MRKNNSAFVARYLSKEGAFLYNNDFYASAEADDFACYLVIDGLEPGEREDLSIRLAAEVVIECFEQKPSAFCGRIYYSGCNQLPKSTLRMAGQQPVLSAAAWQGCVWQQGSFPERRSVHKREAA